MRRETIYDRIDYTQSRETRCVQNYGRIKEVRFDIKGVANELRDLQIKE